MGISALYLRVSEPLGAEHLTVPPLRSRFGYARPKSQFVVRFKFNRNSPRHPERSEGSPRTGTLPNIAIDINRPTQDLMN